MPKISHRVFLNYISSIAIYAMDKNRPEVHVHLNIQDMKNISPAVFRKVYKNYPNELPIEILYPTIFGLLEIFSSMKKLPPIPTQFDMEVDKNSNGDLEVLLVIPLREITSIYDAFPQFAVQLFVREEGKEFNIDYGRYRLEWAAFKPLRKLHRYETMYNMDVKNAFERFKIPLHVLLWRFTRFMLNDEALKISLQDPVPGSRKHSLKGIRDASHVHHKNIIIE